MSDLLISIVVPTRNHRDLLERLLKSISEQSLDPSLFEVLVVDDGSTDGTAEMLGKIRVPYSLTVLRGDRTGPPEARNKGAREAEAAILAFFDDDVLLRRDCLENVVPYFDDPTVGIVEASLMIEGSERPLQRKASAQGFVTAAIFLRKEAFEKAGGLDKDFFDPVTGNFFRDDTNLGFRVLETGYRAVQPDDVVAWHPVLFATVAGSFAHAKRHMFDPLLYRKHPVLFRKHLERKRVGPFSIGRPMHHASVAYLLSLLIGAGLLIAEKPWPAVSLFVVALGSMTVIRYKFEGKNAVRLWRLQETLAYGVLPFWYLYWFVRGCLRFGGWRSFF